MSGKRFVIAGFLMAAGIGASLTGCGSDTHEKPPRPLGGAPFVEVMKMSGALYGYIGATGHPPASAKDLQRFCSSGGLPCQTLDWGKFTWGSVDGNSVTVIYTSGTLSIPISVGKDSVSVSDPNATQDDTLRQQVDEKLKQQLEKLLEDPNGQH